MDVNSLDRQRLARDKWHVATTVLPGQLTIAFGMFGVVVALPNIIVAFGTDVQTVQWVMTGYLMARVVPMPAMGWLVSRLGQRDLYVLGVLGTTVSTVLCGLSWSVESLIVFRVVQGVGRCFSDESRYGDALRGLSRRSSAVWLWDYLSWWLPSGRRSGSP